LKSIKSKLLTFAVLATLIPSLGLGLLSFWRYQVLIGDNVTHELRTLASDASGELTVWFRERVGEVRALSAAYTLIDGLTDVAAPRPGTIRIGAPELELYLRSVQGKLGPLLELTVSDASGRPIASSAAAPAPVVLPSTWPNTAITEAIVVLPPRRDDARRTATLTVVVPILSQRNEFLGALSAVLDLATMQPRLQNIVRSSPADVILLAPDGLPLLGARATADALAPLDPQTVNRLRAQPGEPFRFAGHHRSDVLGIADAPPSLPLLVVAERDRGEVYRAWLKLLELFVALVAGLTLLVGISAWWMGRSIVTPLHHLTDAADRIARGDLAFKLRGAPSGEIGHLTRVFNLMVDRLRHSQAEVAAASQALLQQNQLLETLAATDGLTGVYNRKKLTDILADQFARFRRNHRPFALLMVDIDNFKAINDTWGHAAGDDVLARAASILKQAVRAVDYVARYGGEEFVVVLVETTTDAARDVAERIRSVVEGERIAVGDDGIAVTISVGVTHSRENDDGPEAVLARADNALYEAKRAGRNKVSESP
jgi:diguanylate cyclase (GGDEF)-like protein